MWEQLSIWAYDFRTTFPAVSPQFVLILAYLLVTWIYFRKERNGLALLPFVGGLLFLAPVFILNG